MHAISNIFLFPSEFTSQAPKAIPGPLHHRPAEEGPAALAHKGTVIDVPACTIEEYYYSKLCMLSKSALKVQQKRATKKSNKKQQHFSILLTRLWAGDTPDRQSCPEVPAGTALPPPPGVVSALLLLLLLLLLRFPLPLSGRPPWRTFRIPCTSV